MSIFSITGCSVSEEVLVKTASVIATANNRSFEACSSASMN